MFIVIDGLDGSGKATQVGLAVKELSKTLDVSALSFPNYGNLGCEMVEAYLKGQVCDDADDVNPYAASMFFAVDRYVSYKKSWKSLLKSGKTLIADRYLTSNLIYQGAKINDRAERFEYLEWLYDTEITKIGLPRPDKTIILMTSAECSRQLMMHRYNGDKSKLDIHEVDMEYQKKCREIVYDIGKAAGFDIIECNKENSDEMRSIEDIHKDVMSVINEVIENV